VYDPIDEDIPHLPRRESHLGRRIRS